MTPHRKIPVASGFSACGVSFPPGLLKFVGYGEPGTITEGCAIFEPRLIEMVPSPEFSVLLTRLEPRA